MTRRDQLADAAAEWRMALGFVEVSDLLADHGHYDRATSQLYFGLLHAVRAVLRTEGLEPRSHKGVGHLLHVHFVVSGRIDKEHHRLLNELQTEREGADYVVAYSVDPDHYADIQPRAAVAFSALSALMLDAGVELDA